MQAQLRRLTIGSLLVAITFGIFLAARYWCGDSAAWHKLAQSNWVDESGIMVSRPKLPVSDLRIFGSDVAIRIGEKYSLLDLKEKRCKPIQIPGTTAVQQIAEDIYGNKFALCQTDHGLCIASMKNASWQTYELPAELSKQMLGAAKDKTEKDGRYLLAGEGGVILLASHDHAFVHEGGKWSQLQLKPPAGHKRLRCYINKCIMRNGTAYVSSYEGEWGGGVVAFDIRTGRVQVIHDSDMHPITDLKFAPDGKLWFVSGINHMGLQLASLHSWDGTKVECHSEVQGLQDFRPKLSEVISDGKFEEVPLVFGRDQGQAQVRRKNWDLVPAVFTGLAFDKEGSPLAAVSGYGLLSYRGDKWEVLTPVWRKFTVPTDVAVTPSGLAIMPVSGNGLVLFDLGKRTYQFIFPDELR